MNSFAAAAAIATAVAIGLVTAGCDSETGATDGRADSQSTEHPAIAAGAHVARCHQAMIGNLRISEAEWHRRSIGAGRFGLARIPNALRLARPADDLLAPKYRDVLVTKIPATVRGPGPVTVSVPAAERERVGLLYGSLRGYRVPFARITFVPCDGYVGTSWPGGLALRDRDPVTLLVTAADGDRIWRLRLAS
jgi:hypothetical protein